MKQKMEKEQYRVAKTCLVAAMQDDQSWQRASACAGLQISQSNAYRLWRAYRQRGETALSDGRHGHPSKLGEAARAFLEEQCRQAPQTPSSTVQVELRERFDLHVSISQINRVRAILGISNHSKSQQGKKRQKREALFLNQSGRKVQAGIEGIHSQGIRTMGLRRSRYIVQRKTHLGHVALATAVNVIQLMSWIRGERPEQTRISPFKQLMRPTG